MKRALIGIGIIGLVGCKPASSAKPTFRAQVSSALIGMAYASNLIDDGCVDAATGIGGPKGMHLALTCEKALNDINDALSTADAIIAVWKEGDDGKLACTAKKAGASVAAASKAMLDAGIKTSGLIDDAATVAIALGATCVEAK